MSRRVFGLSASVILALAATVLIMLALLLATAPVLAVSVAGPAAQSGAGQIPSPNPLEAAQAAAAWLASTHQNEDGGYSSFSLGSGQAPSDIGGTLDAILALAAGGEDLAPPVAYLSDNVDALLAYAATDGSTAGKSILALSAAGEDPRAFADNDFVLTLTGHLSPTGQYGVNTAFNQALAMLGSAAAAEPIPPEAAEWLVTLQATDGELAGSWDDGFGTPGNADATAIASMALIASGHEVADAAVAAALQFLANSQLPTGGWEYGAGFGANANSTALVLQALILAGEDIAGDDSPWLKEGQSPLATLLSWQGESGAFQADFGEGRFDDFFSTVQSVPAVAFAAIQPPPPPPTETATPETEPTAPPTEAPPTATSVPTEEPPTPEPEPTATVPPAEEIAEVSPTSVPVEQPEAPSSENGFPLWILAIAGILILAGLAYWRVAGERDGDSS